jgi:predicted CopG family antitoxin
MATKTITVKEEAYERLKKFKDGKSFSEVIMDITEDKEVDLSDSAGLWSDVDRKEIEEKRKEFREDFEERFSE